MAYIKENICNIEYTLNKSIKLDSVIRNFPEIYECYRQLCDKDGDTLGKNTGKYKNRYPSKGSTFGQNEDEIYKDKEDKVSIKITLT